MLLEIILPLSLIAPGAVIQTKLAHKLTSTVERLILSYTLSLALFFVILYIGALTFTFYFASILILLITLGSVIYLMFTYLVLNSHMNGFFRNLLPEYSKSEIIGVFSAGGLILVCIFVLALRPILDSDVAQFYLPIAREIVRFDGFTYSTGYDYNILLKPMGASVLYAWTYALSGSLLTESFRFLPLVPLLVMLGCVYAITKEVTRNKEAAVLSMLIFSVLPFQDRFLLYNAFYPDTFYYPLIFSAILLLLKYTKNREWPVLFIAGVALGVAGLLKAQSIYFLIASLAIIVFVDSGWKRANLAICFSVPFVIFLPNLLIETIRGGGLALSLAGLSIDTLPLLLFLGFILLAAYLILVRSELNLFNNHPSGIKRFIVRGIILLIPVLLISSLWYLTNLFRFGSILSTSTIDLPNYDWALGILGSVNPPPSTVPISNYYVFFGFMFADPAVMGYIWLVVFLVGFIVIVKSKSEGSGTLVMISLLFASIAFSQVVYWIPAVGIPTYNPRDIVILAPMLCTAASVGILHMTQNEKEGSSEDKSLGWTSLFLVTFYGFLSYIHSVVIWFASIFAPSSLPARIFAGLTSIFGLSLRDTSLQIAAADRVPFPVTNALSISLLAIVAGLPILILLIKKNYGRRIFSSRFTRVFGLTKHFTRSHHESKDRGINTDVLLKSILILSVILLPRGILFFQGGVASVTSYSLDSTYLGLQDLADYEIEGILTYRAPDGLPYYLPDHQIIDFRWAANIAYLKDILVLEDSQAVAEGLRDIGITHLLFNHHLLENLDITLNGTLSKLTTDLSLTHKLTSFGGWTLYKLGSFSIERTTFTSLTWNISSQWTNASYTFADNDTSVHIGIFPEDELSRVTIIADDLPILRLSDYDYIQVKVNGSQNALLFIRLFLDDGSGLDISYWKDSLETNSTIISLDAYSDQYLSGHIFIGLVSSDGEPADATFFEITFMKLNLSV